MTNIGTLFYILLFLGPSFVSFNKIQDPGSPTYNDDFISSYTNVEGLFYMGKKNKGLPLKRIVIDAGHGGKDHGCSGTHSNEKEITLAISKQLGKKLKNKFPTLDVLYTREEDRFIPLHERISFANKQRADLFISIHANAFSDSSVQGAEVYVMGLHSSKENLEVAQRENASILMENNADQHYEGFDPYSPVGQIILSMYQNSFLEKSIHLATLISDQISLSSGIKNRGVRQAGFVILRKANMPSVLIESGFLTNPEDEALLNSAEGQKKIAEAMADAIEIYKNELELEFFEWSVDTEENEYLADPPDHAKSFYRVQLMAYQVGKQAPQLPEELSAYPVDIVLEEDMKKVLLGRCESYGEAQKLRDLTRKNGFADAFIVSYAGNERMPFN